MNTVGQFLSLLLIKDHLPGHDEVRDEAGETVPGRTDSHVGEVDVSDGHGLDGGGDWTDGPYKKDWLIKIKDPVKPAMTTQIQKSLTGLSSEPI